MAEYVLLKVLLELLLRCKSLKIKMVEARGVEPLS